MLKPAIDARRSANEKMDNQNIYHLTSRIFYTISFICTTLAFFFYVFKAYEKWKIHPDIAIRRNQKFVSEIPFPALTFCTPIFARPEFLFYRNYSGSAIQVNPKVLNKITPFEANYLISNMQACNPSYNSLTKIIYPIRTRSNVIKLMDESFLEIDEVFAQCTFGAKNVDCTRMFNRVLTDRGFCYTFNMQGFNTIFNADMIHKDFKCYKRNKLSQSPLYNHKRYKKLINDDNETIEWTLEKGFNDDHDEMVIPVAALLHHGMQIKLYVLEKNLNNLCSRYSKTFNYFFHLPNEIPSQFHQKQFIQYNEKSFVTLSATVYKTSEDLRKLKPEARGCYFEGEKKLKFFKSYTKSNCDFECITNFTLKHCGCVKFSMPRDKNTSVCDIDKINCYVRAMATWPVFNYTTRQVEASCGCLRTCSDIKYSISLAEVSSTELKQHKLLKKMGLNDEDAVSYLIFEFGEMFVDEEESYAPYVLQNFIADTGGLLGLFIGCSILSIFEFVYFIIYKFSSGMRALSCNKKPKKMAKNIIDVIPFEIQTVQNLKQDDLSHQINQLRQEFNLKLQEEIRKLNQQLHMKY